MISWVNNFLTRHSWAHDLLHRLGEPFLALFTGLGEFIFFALQTFKSIFTDTFRIRLLFKEVQKIGVNSTLIIALVGLFSGMVFALQTGSAFKSFNAESMVGSTVGLALSRELAPVFTALMIVARAGSAMAAEIGTMTVTEQVDALRSMAVDPINYLVAPRVIATTIAMPLLVVVFNAVGLIGAYLVSIYLLQIPEGPYLARYHILVEPQDFFQGIIKAVLFGVILSLVACYKGCRTMNGAEGVGKSTTQAVVAGSVSVLILNYFLATWLIQIFPD